MLRKENMFRGLILDTDIDGNLTGETTKEWVFGNLIQQYDYLNGNDNDPTLMDTLIRWDGVKEWGGDDEFQVDPKTVGQKTGRQDITGAEIYADDILWVKENNNLHYVVLWSDEESAWVAESSADYSSLADLRPELRCKIVGTFFDEPIVEVKDGNNT